MLRFLFPLEKKLFSLKWLLHIIYLFFWPLGLSDWPGIELTPLTVEVWSLNHLSIREILKFVFPVCVRVSSSVVSDPLRPVDCSRWGSSVHEIFQTRIMEWVSVSSSRFLFFVGHIISAVYSEGEGSNCLSASYILYDSSRNTWSHRKFKWTVSSSYYTLLGTHSEFSSTFF